VTEIRDSQDLARAKEHAALVSTRLDTDLRERLAKWSIKAATTMLLLGTGVFVIYMISEWRHVPQAAILGWLSSSVVEILGIVYLVASYLFPKPEKRDELPTGSRS
jgi:hypothetical protein